MKVAEEMEKCRLCPRNCGVDRRSGKGFCGASEQVKIALVSLHHWEEPCLSGINGAGTVFFSHCNMKCIYCQNYDISIQGKGIEVSVERLAEIFAEQEARGAHCLDLVTPTHYVPQIKKALDIAKAKGFKLPVVYNSSGYESRATIESLAGYVDIYLPDFKYYNNDTAWKYSRVKDYVERTKEAVEAMVEQVKEIKFNREGIMTSGVLVRHMILPWYYKESLGILDYLWDTYGDKIYISLMNQFTPQYLGKKDGKLNRKLTTFEYEKVVDHALELGFTQCYVQDKAAATEEFIPCFNGDNVAHKNK